MQEFLIPSSKSISNRLLIIKHLSKSNAKINNLSSAEDTLLMQNLISQIENKSKETLYCNNAGTVIRFLISLLSITEGSWKIDGSERMRERPLEPLILALQSLGAEIRFIEKRKSLPIIIEGKKLSNNPIIIDSKLSSQFASSLLLISPYINGGLEISLKNPVSMPYINMTISLMKEYGAIVEKNKEKIKVMQGGYRFRETLVEGDWSSACFAYEKLCITKQENIIIKNLSPNSIQGDRIAKDYFALLGIESQFMDNNLVISYNPKAVSELQTLKFDIKNCPDIFPSLAIAGLFSNKTIIFEGIETLKHKESNRSQAVLEGINALGGKAQMDNKNRFIVYGLEDKAYLENQTQEINIKTYSDHRIAMAFGVLKTKYERVKIDNTECVSKSFPMFWANL